MLICQVVKKLKMLILDTRGKKINDVNIIHKLLLKCQYYTQVGKMFKMSTLYRSG